MIDAETKAEKFLLDCMDGGLARSWDLKTSSWVKPYPEVTGYVISTLSARLGSESVRILGSSVDALLARQQDCGGWSSFAGRECYTFDTAQISKGLLDFNSFTGDKTIETSIHRAASFLMDRVLENGAIFPVYNPATKVSIARRGGWGAGFTSINVKVLEFLVAYNESFPRKLITEKIKSIRSWGLGLTQLPETHPGAYFLEGMVAVGELDFVEKRLKDTFLPRVQANGFIDYFPGASHAYMSGSIQLGILFQRIELTDVAQQIWDFASRAQNLTLTGGIPQYVGPDCTLNQDVHEEVNSWGTKYFLELADVLGAGR